VDVVADEDADEAVAAVADPVFALLLRAIPKR
jgi:hypothetical protein